LTTLGIFDFGLPLYLRMDAPHKDLVGLVTPAQVLAADCRISRLRAVRARLLAEPAALLNGSTPVALTIHKAGENVCDTDDGLQGQGAHAV
jgi:hypothetical protein